MGQTKTNQKGVTLLELMISVAILSIVLTVVAPNVQGILIKNRVVAQMNELSTLIQYARNSAIDEQANTVICPSINFSDCTNDWNNPKMVFIDVNNDQTRDSNEAILVANEKLNASLRMIGPATHISFEDSGAANSAHSLKLCHSSNLANYARLLEITPQGRVRLSQDADRDGIHEDDAGNDLSCS